MAQAQAGKVRGPLRIALLLTQGVGRESSKFQKKEEGTFWNYRWVIFPETRESRSQIWCSVQNRPDSHGDRLKTHEGHWAVGAWDGTEAHDGHTQAPRGPTPSAHKLPLSTSEKCLPHVLLLELRSERVDHSVITVSAGELHPWGSRNNALVGAGVGGSSWRPQGGWPIVNGWCE